MAGLAWYKRPRPASASHESAAATAAPTNRRQADTTDAAGTSWSHASLAWHPANAPADSSAAGSAAATEPPDSVPVAECSDALSAPEC